MSAAFAGPRANYPAGLRFSTMLSAMWENILLLAISTPASSVVQSPVVSSASRACHCDRCSWVCKLDVKPIPVEGNNWLKSLVLWNATLSIAAVTDTGACNRTSTTVSHSYIDAIGTCPMYLAISYSASIQRMISFVHTMLQLIAPTRLGWCTNFRFHQLDSQVLMKLEKLKEECCKLHRCIKGSWSSMPTSSSNVHWSVPNNRKVRDMLKWHQCWEPG